LQTAQDLVYDAAAPEKLVETRNELDAKRIVAIQKYLNAQTAGRGIVFQVLVHDPAEPGLPGEFVRNAMQQRIGRARGGLAGGAGAGTGSTSVTGGGPGR
jgi:hypothetical protein